MKKTTDALYRISMTNLTRYVFIYISTFNVTKSCNTDNEHLVASKWDYEVDQMKRVKEDKRYVLSAKLLEYCEEIGVRHVTARMSYETTQ